MPGLIAGAVAAEHVAARNLRKRDDFAAVGGGEGVRSGTIAEGHSLGGAHSALLAALDDEERLFGVDPVGRSRLLPAGRASHIGHVDRADIAGLIRHQGEGHGVAHRGEPVRVDAAPGDDLPLGAGVFEHVHAAEDPHCIAVERSGRRHDGIASVPIAAGEDERDDHAQNPQRHSSLRAKNAAASPSGATTQAVSPVNSAPTLVVAVPASPAMPENWLTLKPVRFVIRYRSVGLRNSSASRTGAETIFP